MHDEAQTHTIHSYLGTFHNNSLEEGPKLLLSLQPGKTRTNVN